MGQGKPTMLVEHTNLVGVRFVLGYLEHCVLSIQMNMGIFKHSIK